MQRPTGIGRHRLRASFGGADKGNTWELDGRNLVGHTRGIRYMQEREEQDDCSMRVVPREIEWIVPSRSIVTKYSGTGHFALYPYPDNRFRRK